jgi:putative (di)nucleoside polyphosphate hydrolase
MEDKLHPVKKYKRRTESPDPGGDIPQTFRAGVGAMIVDQRGRVLILERLDIPGSWQFPQGGLDKGEIPEEAVAREIEEETGIVPSDLEMIASVDRLLAYELPEHLRTGKTGLGQVQYWFVFRFTGSDAKITLGEGKEFVAWQWASMDEAVKRVVDFKKPVYRELADFHRREFGR